MQYFLTVWGKKDYFFLEKLIFLFCKDALNWLKLTVNTFVMLQNISIYKYMLFF